MSASTSEGSSVHTSCTTELTTDSILNNRLHTWVSELLARVGWLEGKAGTAADSAEELRMPQSQHK